MPRKPLATKKPASLPSNEPPGPDIKPVQLAADVAAIRKEIRKFFDTLDKSGQKIGSAKFGIYAFYDYDGEPIYIGQTYEGLSSRIGRHLTNQRTDAVAMNVLDPFEVAEIRVWPLDLGELKKTDQNSYLNRAEYTVFQMLLSESAIGAILNEKPPRPTRTVKLTDSYRMRIIPSEIYPHRKHPDIRIARRANTIAMLARVISERKVSRGLRQTLLTQARRLEMLAAARLKDYS